MKKTSSRNAIRAAVLCWLLTAGAVAAEAPDPGAVERYIAQLSSESWQEREAASAMLLSLGEGARKALEGATSSADPEVRYRARELLTRLRWQPPEGLEGSLADSWRDYNMLSESQRITLLTRMTGQLKEKAVDAVVQVLRHDGSDRVRRQALNRLSTIDAARAEKEIEALAKQEASRKWALPQLAQFHSSRGRTKEAIEAYEQAAALDDQNEATLSALARLYERGEEWAKARKLYEKLTKLSPEGVRRYGVKSGTCLWREGEREKAVALWERMIEEQGHTPEAYTNTAYAYERVGAGEEAIELLRRGTARHPNDYNLLRRLGGKLAEAGKTAEAIDVFFKARRAAPAHYQGFDVNAQLTRLLRDQGKLEDYLAEQEAALRKKRAAVAAQARRLAERHLEAGDLAAQRVLERLATVFPDLPEGRWAAQKLKREQKGSE
jgi:tetratricopeptide (TPR) repeat protein